MKATTLLPLLVLAGCASSGTPGSGPDGWAAASPMEQAHCVTGIVGSQGTSPMTRTVVRGGRDGPTVLDGPAARRVRLLTGALVTVCGTTASASGTLVVERFELRQVDGMEAHLGVVAVRGDGVVLVPGPGRTPLPLASVPDELRRAEGATAWVAGRWEDGGFQPLSFGVLNGW